METVKVGDIVYLKSGSKPMTISEEWDDNRMVCIWEDEKGEHKRQVYPASALTKEKPGK